MMYDLDLADFDKNRYTLVTVCFVRQNMIVLGNLDGFPHSLRFFATPDKSFCRQQNKQFNFAIDVMGPTKTLNLP